MTSITSHRLGTAQWLDPTVLAEHNPYEPGKFWVGRSPLDGGSLGYLDDRHVLLVSGSRAGKGTAVIIPNLCDWPGSILAIDPKGENATVTAARRGPGSAYCEGMGQPVHVLDPFGEAHVDASLRSHYNPLDELDPSESIFLDEVGRIADAIVITNPNASQPFFDQTARSLLKWLIVHVMTDVRYADRRNLVTVRDLVSRGEWGVYKLGKEKGVENLPSAHRILWQAMSENDALGERVAAEGAKMLAMDDRNAKLIGDILVTLDRHTEFLDSEGMAECLRTSDFSMADLKTSESGISVFMCLPSRYMGEHHRWLRMLVTLAAGAMEATSGKPRSGHRVLFCLDEFAGLERMKSIERAVAEIAGAGVTLFFVLQSLEQLKATYKDNWETFVSNCSLKICFGIDDHFTREYLSKFIGDTEVLRNLDTFTQTDGTSSTKTETVSDSETSGDTEGVTQTATEGSSTTRTRGSQVSETRGENVGESRSEGRGITDGTSENRSIGSSKNTNWSKSKGKSDGMSDSWSRNRDIIVDNTIGDTGLLFPFLRKNETVNYSTGSNKGRSKGGGRSRNESQGWGRSRSESENTGWSESAGSSYSKTEGHSESTSTSESVGRSESHSQTRSHSSTHGTSTASAEGTSTSTATGYSQNLQKRPLITPDEIGRVFDRPSDGAPAWGLVLMGGKSPAVVHRSPYFHDIHFQWLFDPHPDHAPGPKLIGEINVQLPGLPDTFGLTTRSVRWLAEPGSEISIEDVVGYSLPAPLSEIFSAGFLARHEPRMRGELRRLEGCELEVSAQTCVGFPITPGLDGIFTRGVFHETDVVDEEIRRVNVIDIAVNGNRRQHYLRHGPHSERMIGRWTSRFAPYKAWVSDNIDLEQHEERLAEDEAQRLADLAAEQRRLEEEELARLQRLKDEREEREARRAQLREDAVTRAEREFPIPYIQKDSLINIALVIGWLVLTGLVGNGGGAGSGLITFAVLGYLVYASVDIRRQQIDAMWNELSEEERQRHIDACYRQLLAWDKLDPEEPDGTLAKEKEEEPS